MKILSRLLIPLLAFFFFNPLLFAQTGEIQSDTVAPYLIKKYKELLEPHADLNFAFGTDELKNELPDLKVETPDLKDTTKYFDKLKGDYKDWFTFYQIGKLYQRFNKGESAFAHYEQAYNLIFNEIRKDSLNAKYYSEMGMLYMSLNSQENAFYFFNKAYELNEKDSLASQFLPMFHIFSGKLDEADKIINKSIENGTDELSSYIWMVSSIVFRTLGDVDKSDKTLINKPIDELYDFSALNIAVKKNEADIRFLVLEQLSKQLALFAKYAVLSGDFEKIEVTSKDAKELKAIRKSLEKFLSKGEFKNQYILYKALGFNYLIGKDLSKSIEMFKKSMTLWPVDESSKDYYLLFTTRYFLQGDTAAALKVIDAKIENDSALFMLSPSDYVLKGNIYLAKDDFENAKYNFQRSLGVGQTPDAWLGLSYIELKEKKLQEANDLINKAYELNKNYYLNYALFGIITLLNNQKDAAKDALENALKIKPDDEIIKEIYDTFFSEK